MPDRPEIRPARHEDLPALRSIVDARLFPAALLDDMIAPFFEDPDGSELWLVTCDERTPVALAFCRAEPMAEGTWNLLALAVAPESQRQGLGRSLIAAIENNTLARAGRLLIIETSNLTAQNSARRLYESLGFEKVARIGDFYAAGEDKIIFLKPLTQDVTG